MVEEIKSSYGEGDVEVRTAQAADRWRRLGIRSRGEGRKAVDEALKKSTFDLVVLVGEMST